MQPPPAAAAAAAAAAPQVPPAQPVAVDAVVKKLTESAYRQLKALVRLAPNPAPTTPPPLPPTPPAAAS